MSVPLSYDDPRMGMDSQFTATSNWTIDVSDTRTVKVSNVSLSATERDIKEFFSFTDGVEYVDMRRESETSQLAYVTFKDSKGADTALLLTGATIVDLAVSITPAENYHLPQYAIPRTLERRHSSPDSTVRKAEDMASSMLAKGFVLGKDALNKAKDFDERHHLISSASATVASLDRQMGLSEMLSIGTGVVRDMDEQFQVSEITRSALSAAEHKASSAGSVLMNNTYVSTGASWVANALGMVAKVAEDVTSMTKEKVDKAEEEKRGIIYWERKESPKNLDQIFIDRESGMTPGEPPIITVDPLDGDKLGII